MYSQNTYFILHTLTITLSYLVFWAASVAAAAYLLQDNALKNKKTGILFSRLPDLAFLDKLIYRSIGLGFPLLTVSIISGFGQEMNIHGCYWQNYNSRRIFALVLWLLYAVILHVRLSEKMRGKKVAILSLLAFSVTILSLFSNCH